MTWSPLVSIKGNTGATGSTVDPTTAGANWFPSAYLSGNYYYCNSAGAVATSNVLVNNTARVSPWIVTQSVTITRLFAEVSALGTNTSVLRVGVWADNGNGVPGTLVLDAGTISTGTSNSGTVGTGVGIWQLTVSQALTPGLYWVGGALQGATAQPTIRVNNNTGVLPYHQPLGTTLSAAAGLATYGWAQSSVSGALGNWTGTTLSVLAPRVGFKVT